MMGFENRIAEYMEVFEKRNAQKTVIRRPKDENG